MPKAFSEHEKKIISEQLREAGRKHFATYGLRKTRVEELAAAVGISKGAFYRFYASKEALFMEIAEEAETHFRQEVLATVDLPGPSPRARLFAVLYKAFTLWKTIPVLQILTRGEYDALARRIPAETLQAHLMNDREFIEQLITRCRDAGIPVQASADQIDGLLHAIFFTSLHEDDLGPDSLTGAMNLLLELVAAYCLGEINIEGKAMWELALGQLEAQHE